MTVHDSHHPTGCEWPFCHVKNCEECERWEILYGQNLDDYLRVQSEIRAAARAEQAAKRRTTRAGGNAPEQPG